MRWGGREGHDVGVGVAQALPFPNSKIRDMAINYY